MWHAAWFTKSRRRQLLPLAANWQQLIVPQHFSFHFRCLDQWRHLHPGILWLWGLAQNKHSCVWGLEDDFSFSFFFFLGQESCHIHPGNRPLTSCVSESDLAGYLCQWMMAVWLQVGQTKSVPAQNDDSDRPALCMGMTPVTQAWALYHIFTYVCWFFCWLCICEIAFLSRHQICCTELEQARQKSCCKKHKELCHVS